MMKKVIKISKENNMNTDTSKAFWLSKTPEERIEAIETIREHYYLMLGYDNPPRIKRTIKFS